MVKWLKQSNGTIWPYTPILAERPDMAPYCPGEGPFDDKPPIEVPSAPKPEAWDHSIPDKGATKAVKEPQKPKGGPTPKKAVTMDSPIEDLTLASKQSLMALGKLCGAKVDIRMTRDALILAVTAARKALEDKKNGNDNSPSDNR